MLQCALSWESSWTISPLYACVKQLQWSLVVISSGLKFGDSPDCSRCFERYNFATVSTPRSCLRLKLRDCLLFLFKATNLRRVYCTIWNLYLELGEARHWLCRHWLCHHPPLPVTADSSHRICVHLQHVFSRVSASCYQPLSY